MSASPQKSTKIRTSFHHYLGRRPVDILLESSPRHTDRVKFVEILDLNRTLVLSEVLKTDSRAGFQCRVGIDGTWHSSSVWLAQ